MPDIIFGRPGWRHRPGQDGHRLTGRMVLLILIAFFGTVGTVNAVMIHYALSSFRGQVEDHPYEAGLAFNSDIVAARAQKARNWKVEVKFDRVASIRQFDVSAFDAQGRPISGLSFTGVFAAPADRALDRRVELVEKGAGVYIAEIPVVAGRWDLELTAKRGDETLFQSKNRVLVR